MEHFYDAIDYPGYAWSNAHPDRMSVMALLHGLEPAPVTTCRVLDIGCNDGANLIPMAYAMPGSEFVGFDIAETPVARAQSRITQIGLSNARVFQADLTELPEDLGTFDYIIAHGVYAWVPHSVRDALLALYNKHLAPNGIAFTSYNAMPGSHLRELTRDILLNRASKIPDPLQGVLEGVRLLETIAQLRPEGDLLGALLAREAIQIKERKPQQVFHDELASAYRPVSISNFANHAARHGLSFVSEATLEPLGDPSYNAREARFAEELGQGDRIEEEQLLDFMRMRSYRETLLCHANLKPSASIRINALRSMRFASQARASEDSLSGARVFTTPTGISREITDANTIAILERLINDWPHGISFADLVSPSKTESGLPDSDLLLGLIQLTAARLIEIHTWEAPVSSGIADRPRASAWSRHEAATHQVMTTLHHHPMKIGDAIVREFVSFLDGTRDRHALAEILRERHPEIAHADAIKVSEACLQLLYRGGILVASDFRL